MILYFNILFSLGKISVLYHQHLCVFLRQIVIYDWMLILELTYVCQTKEIQWSEKPVCRWGNIWSGMVQIMIIYLHSVYISPKVYIGNLPRSIFYEYTALIHAHWAEI